MRAGSIPWRRRPRGFTLVEMLVALALLATVMTVVFATLILQQRSFAVQAERATLQDSLRQGIERLERALREAGSGIPASPPVRLPDLFHGAGPAFLVSGVGILDGGVDGPDSLAVLHALSSSVPLIRGMADAASDLAVGAGIHWEPGMLGLIFDGETAEIFRVSRVDGGGLLQPAGGGIFRPSLSKAYTRGASVTPVRLYGFSVGQPAGHNRTALMLRGVDRDGNLFLRPVVEGVEDLKIRRIRIDDAEPGETPAGRDPVPVSHSRAVAVRIQLASRGRVHEVSGPMIREAVVALRNRGDAR